MNNNQNITWTIVATIFLELLSLVVWTVLFTSDFCTNVDHLTGGYSLHRVGVLCICYVFAIIQTRFTFHQKMVRPEVVIFNSLKATMYVLFMSSLFFLLVAAQIIRYVWILAVIPLFFLSIVTIRLGMRSYLRRQRRKGYDQTLVCLVGDYSNMKNIITSMDESTSGYKPIGYFNSTPDANYPKDIPYLGRVEDFETWHNGETKVEAIFYASQFDNINSIQTMSRYCDNHLIHFYCIPLVSSVVNHSLFMENIGTTPLLTLRREPLRSISAQVMKRLFDVLFSGLFLVTLFPLVLLIFGTWVKLSSPGPIFFRQKRSGLDGKEFWCYKFRSMQVNKDADTLQATKGDSRVTFVGRLMRKTSIDELPQFWNVFIGNMSVVGPRPHMVKHTNEYGAIIDKYMVRHFVKPGITGWAQVTGFRGETHELWQMEERIKKDIWYIENWTFFLDIVIIFKTIKNALMGEDKAY